ATGDGDAGDEHDLVERDVQLATLDGAAQEATAQTALGVGAAREQVAGRLRARVVERSLHDRDRLAALAARVLVGLDLLERRRRDRGRREDALLRSTCRHDLAAEEAADGARRALAEVGTQH